MKKPNDYDIEDILALSVTLMGIGILSFMVPMFGHPFILVSLLNLSGVGSVAACLIFTCLGACLFYFFNVQEKRENGAYLQQHLSNIEAGFQKNNGHNCEKHEKGAIVFPQGERSMSATTYGYCSVRWAEESARRLQCTIKNSHIGGSCSYMQSRLTYLQLLAIDTSAYFVSAILLGVVLPEHIEAMHNGMNIRLREIKFERNQYGNEIELFESFFKRYFCAIYDDVKNIENVDPKVIDSDISNLAKLFIESLEHYNFKSGEKIGVIEGFLIGHLIANHPICVFIALKSQGVFFDRELVSEP
jgi:hypothetical protein